MVVNVKSNIAGYFSYQEIRVYNLKNKGLEQMNIKVKQQEFRVYTPKICILIKRMHLPVYQCREEGQRSYFKF